MKKIFLILLLTLTFNSAFADSPLTSTSFYNAYMDIPLVKKTSKSKGILTDEVFEYLNSKNSIDKKIALINALKWNIKGKKNAAIYSKKLLLLKDYTSTNFYHKGTAEELICYSYIKSLDSYFDVKEAIIFSNRAVKLNHNSYTIAIINQLIKAQSLSQNEWCKVYNEMNTIKENKKLVLDFRKQASSIIFNYIDTYKKYCTVRHSVIRFIKGI